MALKFATAAVSLLLVASTFAARQSPIDIVEKDVVASYLPDLVYGDNYGSYSINYAIENTGHSAQISLMYANPKLTVTGGPLGRDLYVLEQVHFHWGETDGVGSEHLFNGNSTSMEAHLVHYNSKYAGFKEAATKPDGLAVVALFIEGAESSGSFDKNFQRVVEGVRLLKSPHDKFYTKSDLLQWAVPYLHYSNYFTYEGSLTTAPFSENVIWIVYKDPVLVNNKQVAAFRGMHGSEHDLTENFRGVQELDGRVVKFVSESQDYEDENVVITNSASKNGERRVLYKVKRSLSNYGCAPAYPRNPVGPTRG